MPTTPAFRDHIVASVLARAFNEWLRRYTEEPEAYEAEFRVVMRFLEESKDGAEPTYGETQAAYLLKLVDEIGAA